MTRTNLILAAIAAVLALPLRASTETPTFQDVLKPYEAVRVALVQDDVDGVEAPASALETALRTLADDPTAESLGIPGERLAEVEALLPEMREAARALTKAGDLETARDAFYALSKPLVRWRQAAGEGPAVVYCPMTKRSWLQSEADDVGNPYYGQEMPGCGNVVSR